MGETIFGGAFYWMEFSISKCVGLNNKNILKHKENSLKQLTLTVHGLIFGRAYYGKYIFVIDLGGLIFFFGGGRGLSLEFYGTFLYFTPDFVKQFSFPLEVQENGIENRSFLHGASIHLIQSFKYLLGCSLTL